MAASWTGVGAVVPSSATMRTRSADRPSESKVKRSLLMWSRRGHRSERDGGLPPCVDERGRTTNRFEHSGNGYDRAVTATGTPAIELVTRAGVGHRVHANTPPERHGRDRDARPRYGTDAAAALGVEPGRVFKTLAVMVDGGLVLAVAP